MHCATQKMNAGCIILRTRPLLRNAMWLVFLPACIYIYKIYIYINIMFVMYIKSSSWCLASVCPPTNACISPPHPWSGWPMVALWISDLLPSMTLVAGAEDWVVPQGISRRSSGYSWASVWKLIGHVSTRMLSEWVPLKPVIPKMFVWENARMFSSVE